MSDLLATIERIVDQAEAGEAVEVFGIDSVKTSIRAYGGEVESLSSAHTCGVGIRVIDRGRVGYAHTADLSEEALASTLADARVNAQATSPDESNVLCDPAPTADVEGLWDPGAADVGAEDKVDLVLRLEAAVRAAGPPIKGIDAAVYGDALAEVAIASTTGVRGAYRSSDAYVLVEALAERDGSSASASGVAMARHPLRVDVDAAAAEAVERVGRLAGGRKPPSERLPVVLDPEVTAALLGVASGGLSAQAAQRGRSLFADKVGEALAPDWVTIIDDGRHPDGFASAPWDGEGVPTGRTTLLEHGVLRGFLHNCQTAARAGTASTGNGSRGSHRSPPGLSSTNFYLEPGSASREQVLAGVDRGFYCQQVIGVHSGASAITGDISVGASGLMIRDGELAEPVREATVAGSIPALLAGMAVIGDDFRFFPQHGSVGGQTILISEMSLSGS